MESMIKVVHHDMIPDMDFPLHNMQLLFVHPQTIDIAFRKDERRFYDRDAQEFKGFIKQLQDENLLLDDLKELDLEALLGVDGLKALRVDVRTEELNAGPLSINKLEKTI